MQHTLACPPSGTADADAHPTFDVLIVYEDFETGKHAKKTYDFLVEHLGRDCLFSHQMWKFDVLSLPKLRDMAVKDAAAADIIIISSHGDELPAHVKTWIESWLQEPGNPLALVALFDRPQENASEARTVRAYLAGVARQGKMEFFAQPEDLPGSKLQPETVKSERKPKVSQKALSALAGAVQQERSYSYSHWGLNE